MFGRVPMQHTVTGEGDPASIYHDDVLDGWNTQASTQWDGFRHIPHPVHRFYGGLDEKDHGVDHWAERGIVGRGVLADVGRWLEADGRPLALDQPVPIDPEDVVRCLADEGVESEPGDVLLIRTGWLGVVPRPVGGGEGGDGRAAREPGPAARDGHRPHPVGPAHRRGRRRQPRGGGVAAGRPLVAGGLQAAMEDRSTMPEIFVHTALIPLLGIPLGEFFDLDALAEDCAADGRYDVPVHVLTAPPDPGRGVTAERPGHQVAGLLLGRVEVGDDPLDLESGRADPVRDRCGSARRPGRPWCRADRRRGRLARDP